MADNSIEEAPTDIVKENDDVEEDQNKREDLTNEEVADKENEENEKNYKPLNDTDSPNISSHIPISDQEEGKDDRTQQGIESLLNNISLYDKRPYQSEKTINLHRRNQEELEFDRNVGTSKTQMDDEQREKLIQEIPGINRIQSIIKKNAVVDPDLIEQVEKTKYQNNHKEEEELNAQNEDELNLSKMINKYPQRPRFTFKTLVSKLKNKKIEGRDITKTENQIKHVLYVKTHEDARPNGIDQLLILFKDNSFFYRGTIVSILNFTNDDIHKFIRIYLDPTGNHMIVTKKVVQKSTQKGKLDHYYIHLSNVNSPNLRAISLQSVAENEYITSVGWNQKYATEYKTGFILIGTSKKNVYGGSLTCSKTKNRNIKVKGFQKIRDLVPHRKTMAIHKIIGIDIEFMELIKDETKSIMCSVLIGSPDALYEFKGEWRETDPFAFIKSSNLEAVTTIHPAFMNGRCYSFHICYDKVYHKSKFSKQHQNQREGFPMYSRYYKKSLVMNSITGIFHARLNYYDQHNYGYKEYKSCICDAEYIVYHSESTQRFSMNSYLSDPPFPPSCVVPTPNHLLMLVSFEKSLESLVIIDTPSDLCLNKEQTTQNSTSPYKSYAKRPIQNANIVLERKFGSISSIVHSPYFNFDDKLYIIGNELIVEITLTINEQNNSWEKYYERANSYLPIRKSLTQQDYSLSQIQSILKYEDPTDYYILTFRALNNEIGEYERRDMVIASLAQYYFNVGRYLASAYLFSSTRVPVSKLINQFLQQKQLSALRHYLLLKYNYNSPIDAFVQEELGPKVHEAFTIVFSNAYQNTKYSNSESPSLRYYMRRSTLALTDAEVVSLIVELYLEEINQLHEEWDIIEPCQEEDRRKQLAKNIQQMKREFKHHFLNQLIHNDNKIYARMDKDRIYKLMTSHGHLKSAVKYSNQVKDYEKVLSYHISKSFDTKIMQKEVIDIFEKLPLTPSKKDRDQATKLFIKYSGRTYQFAPAELVNVISTKPFLNSMLLLPSLTNNGEFLRETEEEHLSKYHSMENSKHVPSIHKAYQYYEKALKHAHDVTKGEDCREETYIMNTLVTLYSRLNVSTKYKQVLQRLEMNQENLEYASRRSLIHRGVAFNTMSQIGLQDPQDKVVFDKNIVPTSIGAYVRGFEGAAIAYHRLGLNKTAIDFALSAANELLPYCEHEEVKNVRQELLKLSYSIATNPTLFDSTMDTPENFLVNDSSGLSKELWTHIIRQLTTIYRPTNSPIQLTINLNENLLQSMYAKDTVQALQYNNDLSVYDVMSSIHDRTITSLFQSSIDSTLTKAPRSKKMLSSTPQHKLLENENHDYIQVKGNQQCSAFHCCHDSKHIFSKSIVSSSLESQPSHIYSFQCGHVFHENCLESIILNHPNLVEQRGDSQVDHPKLTLDGRRALHESNYSILPVNIKLTRVRLLQLNHRLNSLDLEMNSDIKEYAPLLSKYGHDAIASPEDTSSFSQLFQFYRFKAPMDTLVSRLREEPRWRLRRAGLMKRILKRIALNVERTKLLSKMCPRCSSIVIPEIHLGFVDTAEHDEWSVDPLIVPDFQKQQIN